MTEDTVTRGNPKRPHKRTPARTAPTGTRSEPPPATSGQAEQPQVDPRVGRARPEPLPPPVLADVLDQVAALLRRHVAFPSTAARDAVALWAAHTHVYDRFDSTPRLCLVSAEKQSGKTRSLELLELLVPRAVHVANITVAALFRLVEAEKPTFLLDEADRYFGRKSADQHEDLIALVNAGHRSGATVPRVVGDGASMSVRKFPVFAPAAIAGIGELPDTITDRSVFVRMRRRAPDEQVEPFRRRTHEPAGRLLHDHLAAWALADDRQEALGAVIPDLPAGLVDRPADVWEPLIVIADAAGRDWPARARASAVALNQLRADHEPSFGVRLLDDLRAVFRTADKLPTAVLLERLNSIEEAPWADMGNGRGLDPRRLADHLREFGVASRDLRTATGTLKGYTHSDLDDAWRRYLPPDTSQGRDIRDAATPQVTDPDPAAPP